LKIGAPMDENTVLSELAREDVAEDLEDQRKRSGDAGAKMHHGGKRKGTFYEPTVLIDVTPEMPVFVEETFGPVISVTKFKTDGEAVDLVNRSDFGLGVSLFTNTLQRAEALIPQFEDGAVLVNELVKSDPRLPFGSTKISGYRRERSLHGTR